LCRLARVARLGARGAPSSLPATGLVTDTAAARAAIAVARRLVSRPARARALARLAARGPAPRSRTAPIRERHRGAAAAHTLVVVAPVAAHVVISLTYYYYLLKFTDLSRRLEYTDN
jgi:hypothetical protein